MSAPILCKALKHGNRLSNFKTLGKPSLSASFSRQVFLLEVIQAPTSDSLMVELLLHNDLPWGASVLPRDKLCHEPACRTQHSSLTSCVYAEKGS